MKTKTIPCHVCNGRGFISKFSENKAWSESCGYCHGTGTEEVPITNADYIRAMTDKELTEFIGHNSLCDRVQDDGTWCDEREVCGNCLIAWLQQPAE